jgi:hypothetical protein
MAIFFNAGKLLHAKQVASQELSAVGARLAPSLWINS